ncbi:VOC family protein [Nocardioides sp.]|uniref:VOC family protein n=1 Tax=Nocardioides sp. TaxID=35761 RepID=UPI003D10DBE6
MTTWQLTIDANDPSRLVEFWAPVLGYERQPAPEGFETWNDWYRFKGVPEEELDPTNDGCDRIHDPSGAGPRIWFQIVPEVKSIKNRFHLDVYPTGRDPLMSFARKKEIVEAFVADLVSRGATIGRKNVDEAHRHYFVLMHDPEGNEFCVA